ncbi:MAG: hypothetical protein QOI20_993 [Acidimicrobiaceae bacterium]|jgi:hypothetical protein|nr:hypothetical protein [Acidimicrobiaceae bacterium]
MRIRHRVLAIVLATGAVAASGACGTAEGVQLSFDYRRAALRAAVEQPRTIEFEHTEGSSKSKMSAAIEDDYRYRGAVTSDGALQYEEVVYDDVRAVRLADPQHQVPPWVPSAGLAPLLAGSWVADAAHAPNEFLNPSAPEKVLDPRLTLDFVRSMETWTSGDGLKLFARAKKWDPKGQTYERKDDKFDGHKEFGVRYDVFPIKKYDKNDLYDHGIPPYFSSEMRTRFLYSSFWFKDGRITRVEERLAIDVKRVRKDLKWALKRAATKGRVKVKDIRAPLVPLPYHEVTTIAFPGPEAAKITLPQITATVVLPPRAFPQPAAAPPTTPTVPAGTPSAPAGATMPAPPAPPGVPAPAAMTTTTTRKP